MPIYGRGYFRTRDMMSPPDTYSHKNFLWRRREGPWRSIFRLVAGLMDLAAGRKNDRKWKTVEFNIGRSENSGKCRDIYASRISDLFSHGAGSGKWEVLVRSRGGLPNRGRGE